MLPDLKEGAEVSPGSLLNHASGVPSYTSQPRFIADYSPRDLTHAQLLATIKDVVFASTMRGR